MSLSQVEDWKTQTQSIGFASDGVGKDILQQQAYQEEDQAVERQMNPNWGNEDESQREKVEEAEDRKMEDGEERMNAGSEIELARITARRRPAQACPEDTMSRPGISHYQDGENITWPVWRGCQPSSRWMKLLMLSD